MRWSAYGKTVTKKTLCRHTPKVGAVCPNWARTDLCGGRSVMSVPTAISEMSSQIIPLKGRTDLRGIQPNSGPGDHSRLSCSAGDTQLGGWVLLGSSASVLHGCWPSCGVARRHELAAISFDQKMIRRRQSQQHHCAVCAGLSAQRERVW